ncbi:unnamed protein product [Owenia fusiformis]|uniref:Uncharacterized protein n=1 Tax=Owenia fusiformis TaxID=6347 RepID=A0A8J1UXH2_OWEFU|nr:unnamed protein product [Owenia fusiformis]
MEFINSTQKTDNDTIAEVNKSTKTSEVLYVMVLYSIGIVANTHWLYGMYRVKKLHVRDNYFHINLSVVHIIGMVKIIIASLTLGFGIKELTILNTHLQHLPTTSMSAVLLCIIGGIRLARLTHPYMYLTTRLTLFLLMVPWLLMIAIMLMDIVVPKKKRFLYVIWPSICCASSVMVMIYMKMFHTLYKRNIKTDVSPITMATESRSTNSYGRVSKFEIFIIDDIVGSYSKEEGTSHIDNIRPPEEIQNSESLNKEMKKSAKKTQMIHTKSTIPKTIGETSLSSHSTSSIKNTIAETSFTISHLAGTNLNAKEDITKKKTIKIPNTNVKRMEDAHMLLVKEYRMIVINSLVVLLISLMHMIALSFISWREGQEINGVPYAKLPTWIGHMHIHIMFITYNIIPIISYIKSDDLRKELRKCYCCYRH